ncbi:MAG: hypothetical protein M1828_004094 [Chrysothrix sp. TS-e1954]|nr:MAG: hypothetical protein M1828_004094 [Chrysothrix sp. TS-e1954]
MAYALMSSMLTTVKSLKTGNSEPSRSLAVPLSSDMYDETADNITNLDGPSQGNRRVLMEVDETSFDNNISVFIIQKTPTWNYTVTGVTQRVGHTAGWVNAWVLAPLASNAGTCVKSSTCALVQEEEELKNSMNREILLAEQGSHHFYKEKNGPRPEPPIEYKMTTA